MNKRLESILAVLRQPDLMRSLSLPDWDVLIPGARSARLLSRLAVQVRDAGRLDAVPREVRWHLDAALVLAAYHDHGARWGWRLALQAMPVSARDCIVLKGVAYLLVGLPNSRGRLYNDIDILVPEGRLNAVERALCAQGWETLRIPAHQERYYRRWLHELPVMAHRDSGARVDVHHNILPAIDRIRVDAGLLRAAAVPVGSATGPFVLCPADMVLHSAAHLFRRGVYANGLRDLVDLDDLMRHFAAGDAAFWPGFRDRAERLGLGVPAALAVRYARRFMLTPVPEDVQACVARWLPASPVVAALDRLIECAITPPDLEGGGSGRAAAHWCLERYPLCLWKKSVLPKLERLRERVGGLGGVAKR